MPRTEVNTINQQVKSMIPGGLFALFNSFACYTFNKNGGIVSIGGHGDKMEKMYNSQRSVPLFEFRDLFDIQTSETEDFMTKLDSTIQTLHKDFASPPKKRKRDVPASCTMPGVPAQSSSTNPAPVVVALVDPPSQPTCVPTLTSDVKDSHEGELQKAAKYFRDEYASNTNVKGLINIARTDDHRR
ncbi:MAG: hypothetical protein Q9166_001526 [cf. Caloplaca sp. 2 TL-2023]